MVVYRVPPSALMLTLPLFVMGTMAVAAGAGLLFSALIVSYRDFRYVITYVVQIWLFATPVLYSHRQHPRQVAASLRGQPDGRHDHGLPCGGARPSRFRSTSS